MSSVLVLVLLAGLSEATGRVLPLASRRPGMARPLVAGLLLTGALVEAAVVALWPLTAWTLATALPTAVPDSARLSWTPGLIAPLLLAAVLGFPLLGPLLHLLLLVGVGATLAGPLAAATGLSWVLAAGCVAAAGVGLALAVDVVRRLVAAMLSVGVREATA